MNPLSLPDPRRFTTPQLSPAQAPPSRRGGRVRGCACALAVLAVLTPGLVRAGILRPPEPPQVAPIVSDVYPSDTNGNAISDTLERAGGVSIAAEGSTTETGGERVAVQMIFREPVTQRQIDDFLALGGQITYLFKAISYGWNGSIARDRIASLPALMGPSLAQVEPIVHLKAYMDLSSQTGRVRPIWRPGFADNSGGFRGDPNTTIAFIDTGVDGTHKDLRDRCVYWRDLTDDNEPSPVDYNGHGSLCAGVALGTGASGGAGKEELRYTYVGEWPAYVHLVDPISLPLSSSEASSVAYWRGSRAAILHVRWSRGTFLDNLDWTGATGGRIGYSPVGVSDILIGERGVLFSTALIADSEQTMDSVVIKTSIDPYPGIGDGFNKFSGVAPECRWAAAKIASREGVVDDNNLAVALDDLVARREEAKIKVLSVSYGLSDDEGMPIESVPLRDQFNTIVNNGIVVVSAAGNSGEDWSAEWRKMADPPRAAMAITVGAVNDENILTSYSSEGFSDPRENEDYKPDVLAPGGSVLYTGIMSVDSGTCDGEGKDMVANDHASGCGTSLSAPFVAGSAALVIQALEQQGVVWDYSSSELPRYVKMLLCATASETNIAREKGSESGQPTLQRASNGPKGFPCGKDPYEGYGVMNPDAAVEAVCQSYEPASEASIELGKKATDKRVWARTLHLTAGCGVRITLDNPPEADFDVYLYSAVPSRTGTPVLLESSAGAGEGLDESLRYSPAADMAALLVVKRVSGAGTATLRSTRAAPPVAQDVALNAGTHTPTMVTLQAVDDGSPTPPGALTYTIVSLPSHGQLENVAGGTAISQVPATLPGNQVVYRSEAGWVGEDSFTFRASDGGVPPFAGASNTATVHISVQREVTVEYRVSSGADDASGMKYGASQDLSGASLSIGSSAAGMRFVGVQVPPGAVIKSAKLSVCSFTYGLTGSIEGRIRAEAADNPADFSGRRVATLKGTSASQAWNWDSTPWTANTSYESPDLRTVLQEIIDRPGWSSGNAVVILYSCTSYDDDRRFWSFDGAPEKAARLKITYEIK